ncbi:MAG: pyridoxal phosphate-dependent aminotransferase [Pseudomonadota bacterium]
MVKFNPIVAALPDTVPFVAPEETERRAGRGFRARLGANEGNFGPSPQAIEAMQRAARDEAWKYCDPTAHDLRVALAAKLGIAPGEVIAGPGIDGLLGLIVRIFSDVGDTIVTSLGAYPTFNFHVSAHGRTLHPVPYAGAHEDLDALADAARTQRAAIIYVSNPDNPMGTWWDASAITRFCDTVPHECLIVLDEAYGETAPPGTLPSTDTSRPNLIRLRTFSKAYGLAGLRCGYAFGHDSLITPFHRVRDHFGVNVMAQAAALAALGAHDWLAEMAATIADGRERIAAIAEENGLTSVASATNFVALDCGGDGAFANHVLQAMMRAGVFVRKPMTPGLDHHIRVSVGRKEELDVLEEVLPAALAAAAERSA